MRRLGPNSESATQATGVGAGKTGSDLGKQIGGSVGSIGGGILGTVFPVVGNAAGAAVGGALGTGVGAIVDYARTDEGGSAAGAAQSLGTVANLAANVKQEDAARVLEYARGLIPTGG
jgi:hypothetical protein